MGEQIASGAHQPSCRVLILDLEASILIALERVFEEAGFDTTTTWNIYEAVLYLEKRCFDLIVVGDHPPEIDAYAVLRRIETIRQHVPCIVMRAARLLPANPKLNMQFASIPGCASDQVLEQARQHLR